MTQQAGVGDGQKTLLDLLADFWRARVFIICGIGAGMLAAGAIILAATPHYRAQMMISPASPVNGAEVSSLMADSNLFALRYLAQSLGGANSSDFMRFENTYDGPSVAGFLLKDPRIVEGLAEDAPFGFLQKDTEWSAVRLADYIGERVRLEPVGVTPLRRMVYLHPDREFGAYFLHSLHRLTDELIRQKIRQDSGQRVRYLKDSIEQTGNPDHKRALTALLMEQERLLMLVSIETPYAANVIEPPAVSRKPVWPDGVLLFPVLIFIGALSGFFAHGFFSLVRNEKIQGASQNSRRKIWFKTDSGNENEPEPVLSARDAAE